MRVPVRIPVLGRKVRVVYVERLHGGDRGEACLSTCRILISRSAAESAREVLETIYHELMHIALHLTGHSEVLGIRREEGIVYALDNALAPLLMLNPGAGITWREVAFDFED